MRYRRLSYRYLIAPAGQPRPLGPFAEVERALGLAQLCWRPPADVYETPDEVVVTVELAGMEEDDFELLLFDDALVLEGKRRLARPEGEAQYHAAEIRQGALKLELQLPAIVDPDGVEARYERGLLQVNFRKAGH